MSDTTEIDDALPERFFYHSFPRRGRNSETEIEKGCKILTSIRDFGLLLTPEITIWSNTHKDGSPPRKQPILQRSASFTDLLPGELDRHSKTFGHFSLEFSANTIKGLGAIPVHYIPCATAETGEVAGLGETMVVQANDAKILIDRIAAVKKWLDENPSKNDGELPCNFGFENIKEFKLQIAPLRGFIDALTYALTPPHMLEHSIAALLSLFYPADDTEHNKELLAYYRQREWRIVGNFSVRGEEVMRLPSAELINGLLKIDAEFWGKLLPDLLGSKRTVDETLVYPGIGKRRIIEMANRVIVPAEAVDSAKTILSSFTNPPPVVSITSSNS